MLFSIYVVPRFPFFSDLVSFFSTLFTTPYELQTISQFFDSLEYFTISGKMVYDLIVHLPDFLILKKYCNLSENVHIYRRDYLKIDESALINNIWTL